MFDNEIVSPGEKIKRYRKQILRATQDEIAQDVCSKSMISQIENNKENLTYILATGIADNFNEIAKDKGIKIELITADDLIKDENFQANYIFKKNIIDEMQGIKELNIFEEKLCEAEELIKKYDVTDNNKIQLYKLAADFYYYKSLYSKSEKMCNQGLKVSINSENVLEEAHMYTSKSRNNMNQRNYLEALAQLEHAEKINNIVRDTELFERIFFNKALIYKKIGKYDKALEYLRILRKEFNITNIDKLLEIKLLYANCLNYMKNFNEAEKEYISILEPAMKFDNKSMISLTYKNLSELYWNKKDYKSAARYIKEAIKTNPNNVYLNETQYFAGKVSKKLGEDAQIYFLDALKTSEENDRENLDLIEKIIYELVLIYIDEENEEKLDLMITKSEELNIKYDLIFPEVSEYYRHRNEEKSININQKLIKKSRQIKNI